ncbi:hypothetical protein [Sphingobacterium sp. UBA5670]|uniref:hypothetical protein n=1 Tax=Sphingobacterium sp. UBA5670 TaxID=1947502 RepID=UPI0025E34C46|nr:hypothetical protein [Sphingobacterium sp. UBA5670]
MKNFNFLILLCVLIGINSGCSKPDVNEVVKNVDFPNRVLKANQLTQPTVTLQASSTGTAITANVSLSNFDPDYVVTEVSVSCNGTDGTVINSVLGAGGGNVIFYGIKGFSYTVVATVSYKSKTGSTMSPISKTATLNISQSGGSASCTYPSTLANPSFPSVIERNGNYLFMEDGELFVLYPTDNKINVNIVVLYRERGSNQEWSQTDPINSIGAYFPGIGQLTLVRIVGLKSTTEYELKSAIQCNDKLVFTPGLFYASTLAL